MSDAALALSLADVSFSYGGLPALRGVTLGVQPGRLVGIIGPNGSGKTTLLRVMSGVLRPDRGDVAVFGRPIASYKRAELGRRLAVAGQESTEVFPFTVMEMVLLGRIPHRRGLRFEGRPDLRAAARALERTGTSHLARRLVTELSGGERQRVLLARALAQEPEVLLLDEPSAFQDVRHQVELYDLLRDLSGDGLTVVTVLHDLNLAALYCEELFLFSEGRLVRAGPPEHVLNYALLTEIYGTELYVARNEITGRLNILPLDRPHRERLRARPPGPAPGRGGA